MPKKQVHLAVCICGFPFFVYGFRSMTCICSENQTARNLSISVPLDHCIKLCRKKESVVLLPFNIP